MTRALAAAMLAVVVAIAGLAATAPPAEATIVEGQFKDVPTDYKFYTEIAWLADQQITTGWSDGTFRPRESVTREAFAAFLYRLAGKPAVTLPSRSPFTDVAASAPFYREIVWLAQKGITTGWSDGTFRPKDRISREAIAAFLYRYEGRPTFTPPTQSPFSDMTPSSKFYTEVTWLSRTGMTTGYADGTFRPKSPVSREAIAAFLYRGNTVARGDGYHRVGVDIAPGTYTLVAAESSAVPTCYWVRTDARSTTPEHTLGYRVSHMRREVITIEASDRYLYTQGCSGLTPLRPLSPWASTVSGSGVVVAGYHMRAGTYRATGEYADRCYWEKFEDFSGWEPGDWTYEPAGVSPVDVHLTAGQGLVFDPEACGSWRRIGD